MKNKRFIWLIAFLALGVLLLALAFRPTPVDKWEAARQRISRLKTETRLRKLPRSALRGKLTPGNAWDEYNNAMNDGVSWKDDPNGALLGSFLRGDTKVDRAKVTRSLADHKGAIEHLRLGAQRSEGQFPYKWERGSEMPLPSLMASRRLANLAVAQGKVWAESGRPQDAADLLLDVSVFARDLATNAPLLSNLIGIAMYTVAFDEVRNLILSGKLTQKQLADLAKKLETVDHDFPTFSSSFSNETLLTGLTMLEVSAGGKWSDRIKEGGMRFALHPRRMMTEAFEEKESYAQRAEKFDHMDFAAAKKDADAINAEAQASTNALVQMSMPDLSRILVVHREALARLRLLRAGTILLATGEMPTLADPFGDHLFYKQEGAKAKIWSIGRDGKNNNGAGTWNLGQPDMLFELSK